MNKELDIKFQSFEDLEVPLLPVRKGGDTKENIEANPLEVRRLIKELDQQKAHGLDDILPLVHKNSRDSRPTTDYVFQDLPY